MSMNSSGSMIAVPAVMGVLVVIVVSRDQCHH